MHILLVDNDIDDRELFVQAFEAIEPDFEVTSTYYEPDLFVKFEDLKYNLPDFIFLDLNMEEKSGIDCLDEIKTIPWLNDVPVIIYSTSTWDSQIEKTFQKGASLYVEKPSSFEEMKMVFRKILDLPTDFYFPQAEKENYLFKVFNFH